MSKTGSRLARVGAAGASAVLVVALLASTTLAAKPGGGGSASGGTCYETPNPVALGALYTVYGNNLGTNISVDVNVTDSAGTTVLMGYTGSTGSVVVSSYAGISGTYQVTIVGLGGHKTKLLATCSFLAS